MPFSLITFYFIFIYPDKQKFENQFSFTSMTWPRGVNINIQEMHMASKTNNYIKKIESERKKNNILR